MKNVDFENGSFSRKNKKGERFGVKLRDAVAMWPTPQADDSKNSGRNQKRRETLTSKVYKTWATPACDDAKNNGNASQFRRTSNGKPRDLQLNAQVVQRDLQLKPGEGVLNPNWVEWLMGWPVGWTSLEPLTELKFRDWSIDPADNGEIPRVTTIKTNRVSRLKAIGNGQVPAVVHAMERLTNEA